MSPILLLNACRSCSRVSILSSGPFALSLSKGRQTDDSCALPPRPAPVHPEPVEGGHQTDDSCALPPCPPPVRPEPVEGGHQTDDSCALPPCPPPVRPEPVEGGRQTDDSCALLRASRVLPGGSAGIGLRWRSRGLCPSSRSPSPPAASPPPGCAQNAWRSPRPLLP